MKLVHLNERFLGQKFLEFFRKMAYSINSGIAHCGGNMSMTAVKTYDTKTDIKKRITLRNSKYEYYHVQEFADGRIVLEPRELVVPFEVSKATLDMMDSAMKNLKNGKVSEPLDLTEFEA